MAMEGLLAEACLARRDADGQSKPTPAFEGREGNPAPDGRQSHPGAP
jgi:hypothetical protein